MTARMLSSGVVAAVVERVVPLGFEVRVDLRTDTGEHFAAQVSRRDAAQLQLRAGETAAGALRRAKLRLIAEGHPPFYWAPFVLHGR